MKVTNLLKMASVSVLMMMMVGCASVDGMSKNTLNNKAGEAYGYLSNYVRILTQKSHS